MRRPLSLLVFLVAMAVHVGALDMSIAFHDERVYFVDSPISIAITISNETASPSSFRLADDRRFTVDFELRDDANRVVPRPADFTIARMVNQVYYRTITLEPGEQLTFVEPLGEFAAVSEPGTYRVQGSLFPLLFNPEARDTIASNPLTLVVRPGASAEERSVVRFEAIARDALAREDLAPDEVVTSVLEALQRGEWDRFFLYLNLEAVFRQDPDQDRRFRRLGEADQRESLAAFREELQAATNGEDLVVVPSRFRILETTYTPTTGSVVAELEFDRERFREIKRYRYELERRNGLWEIIGYAVTNLPNQALR